MEKRWEEDTFPWGLTTWMERFVLVDWILSGDRDLSFKWEERASGHNSQILLGSLSQPHLWVLSQHTLSFPYKEIGMVNPWSQHKGTAVQGMILNCGCDMWVGGGKNYFLTKEDSYAKVSSKSELKNTFRIKGRKGQLRPLGFILVSHL